jgi:polyferredoxin
MKDQFRIWTGIILILISLVILWIPAIEWVYGSLGIVLGIVILSNKNEDKIEQRKDMKGGSK